MFHKLILLVLGPGAGKQVLLLDLASPLLSRTGPGRESGLVVSVMLLISFHFN
jgi:hypothetical protein